MKILKKKNIPDLNLNEGDSVYFSFHAYPAECSNGIYYTITSDLMIVQDKITSIDNTEELSFSIVNNLITFNTQVEEVMLTNILGSIISNLRNVNQLNISHLKGIYILSTLHDGKLTRKIVSL